MLFPSSVDSDDEKLSGVASPSVPAPEALARAVRQRRAELRSPRRRCARRRGCRSPRSARSNGATPDLTVQAATLRRLDLALEWPVGTAESWLAGHGGVVTPPARWGEARWDEARWVETLAPLVAAELRVEREQPTLSLAGLPHGIVVALEHLVRELHKAFDG